MANLAGTYAGRSQLDVGDLLQELFAISKNRLARWCEPDGPSISFQKWNTQM